MNSDKNAIFGLGIRGAAIVTLYSIGTFAVLLSVIVLRRNISTQELLGYQGFLFIGSLAAGLEPATAKAVALRGSSANLWTLFLVSAGKGILLAPILALVWRFAVRSVEMSTLCWLPLLCIVGFWTSDARVLIDLKGRHAAAVGLKQVSLAGGVTIGACALLLGANLTLAVAFSTLARLVLVVGVLALSKGGLKLGSELPAKESQRISQGSRGSSHILKDVRWMEIAGASAVSAASGSADRFFALRSLAPIEYTGYFLITDVLTKFWLIPYLICPIIFARRAAGIAADRLLWGARVATVLGGTVFLVGTAAFLLAYPSTVAKFVGTTFGESRTWFVGTIVVGCGLAVVLGCLTQLRFADLQGAGEARRVFNVSAGAALLSLFLFYFAAKYFGAPGLLWAWLIKALIEWTAAMLPVRGDRARVLEITGPSAAKSAS